MTSEEIKKAREIIAERELYETVPLPKVVVNAVYGGWSEALDEVERLQYRYDKYRETAEQQVQKLRAIAEAAEKYMDEGAPNSIGPIGAALLDVLETWRGEPGTDANGSPVY